MADDLQGWPDFVAVAMARDARIRGIDSFGVRLRPHVRHQMSASVAAVRFESASRRQ